MARNGVGLMGLEVEGPSKIFFFPLAVQTIVLISEAHPASRGHY